MGDIKELEQKVTIGTLEVEAHYNAKKEVTTVKRKIKEKDGDDKQEKVEILSGLVIIGIKTDTGSVYIDY